MSAPEGSFSNFGGIRDSDAPSREALQHLTETVPALVYIAEMGEHGRWLYASPQIEEILGYEADEWMSDPDLWHRSLHPDDVEHAMAWEEHDPYAGEVVPSVEYRLRRRDGRYVWVYECTRLVPDPYGGPALWHGVISDISALKEAEAAVQRKAEQQATTAQLGVAAVRSSDQQAMIETAVEALLGLGDIVEAEIWEHIADNRIKLRYRSNYSGPELVLPFEGDRYPGNRLADGDSVTIRDWDDDERMVPYAEHRNPAVASTMVVPIPGTQRPFGFLSVHASVVDRFSRQDEDFLLAGTSLIGSMIERSRVERSLRHRLLYDGLTELPNREHFTQRLEAAMENSLATGIPMAVLFLDIDRFKLINDGISHHAGDHTLREVGVRLTGGLSTRDTVARFGGDEFGIVIESVGSAADALRVAESLLDLLVEPITFEGGEIVITASVGATLFEPEREPDKEAGSLLREADAAMHMAKDLGRAQSRMFDEPLRSSAQNRLRTESGLRSAIEHGDLVLHYQPVVSIQDHRIVGFEALVRWKHPERGLIPAADFVPVAEESGLISQIDGWALEEVARQVAEWQPFMPEGRIFAVSVNASARQLNRTALPKEVAKLIDRYPACLGRLALEITESTLIAGQSSVAGVLDDLHEMGVRLALDDFGTGFSSLSYLSRFPLDVIKIDRSFVVQLGNGDSAGRAVTDAILRIGDALSMMVIAEGVSTATELAEIRRLGCRLAQGFLMSPPVPAGRATQLLRAAVIPLEEG